MNNAIKLMGILILLAVATISNAFAGSATKAFEIGEGTAHPRSNFKQTATYL